MEPVAGKGKVLCERTDGTESGGVGFRLTELGLGFAGEPEDKEGATEELGNVFSVVCGEGLS